MVLVLLALSAGVAAGYACGGRLRQLAADPPVRNRLILTALGVYAAGVIGSWAWDPLLPAMSALCWLILSFYALLNRSRRGAHLLALGLAANGLVILLNGAMPVSSSAEARAGVVEAATAGDLAGRAVMINGDTNLPWLGKVVPVAFPPRPEVVSPGDIAIAAGCATALATGMARRRQPVARQSVPALRRQPTGALGDVAGSTEDRARMDPEVTAEIGPEPPRATA